VRGMRRGAGAVRRRRWWRWVAASLLVIGLVAALELRTSWIQSRLFAAWASGLSYEVEPGPEPEPWVGSQGPHDVRRGYTRLAPLRERLDAAGFAIDSQARVSSRFRRSLELGLYPVFTEKPQAGLTIVDRTGVPIYAARYPGRVYPAFDSIPTPIVRTLLFIENRDLLQSDAPNRNPVVEWDRLARSLAGLLGRKLGADTERAGGSTLATQIEKYRHSPDGLTRTPRDKLVQMATATARAYRGGPKTENERQRIVLEYINSVPLAAVGGYGEVLGLQDALAAWFGLDPARVNAALRGDAAADSAGVAYRAVLALLLAQRRPSFYLTSPAGREQLDALIDFHLRLLERQRVVSPDLLSAAREARPQFRTAPPSEALAPFADRKAANAMRTRLLGLAGTDELYVLDRLDLSAVTTIDRKAQDSVTRILNRLADPEFVRAAGLDAPRLVGAGDPSRVVYSFLLYEAVDDAIELRVQTDNFPGPFDINESSRLELGSTAKLRTLVTYLELVEALHHALSELDPASRRAVADSLPDPLTRWAVEILGARPDATLRELLDASMQRRYSANPAERFFTGGGQHVFQNFDHTFDASTLTVADAFRNSVNLVFVRIMRDIERYHRVRLPAVASGLLEDPDSPERRRYLEQFADREGRQFVSRFWSKYADRTPDEIIDALFAGRRLTPRRLAWTFRAVRPEASLEEFASVLEQRSPDSRFTPTAITDLYRMADVTSFDLADRGYLAGVHPLELWVADFRLRNPAATRADALAASADARQDVYRWLFSARRRQAQERSISIMLEIESFLEVQRAWRRLGYPFENLVPSYGSSIGSSGDRPEALAELVGIILNGGVRLPTTRIRDIDFAVGTPYETRWSARPTSGETVMSAEVAAVARGALLAVTADGTARSVRDAFHTPAGDPVPIGGKTGTGNNQFKVFGSGGGLVGTRTINRTATFVFFLGDRHFGVVTAHVNGDEAAGYAFTSALPLAVLRLLAPSVAHLLGPEPAAMAAVRATSSVSGR